MAEAAAPPRRRRISRPGPGRSSAHPTVPGRPFDHASRARKPLVAEATSSVPFPGMTLNNSPERERDPFLEAVGRVTLAAAQLDISLKSLLGAIAHEPTLIKYANSQNTSKLLEFCKLALKVGHLAPEDVTEIAACLARAEKCRDRRNTIVHAIYMPSESGDGLEAMNPVGKKLGYRVSSISVEEMEALADEVTVLRDDMFTAGWNANAGKMPGMPPIPPRKPGQRVNGVLPKA